MPPKLILSYTMSEATLPIRIAIFDDSENRRLSLQYLIGMHGDMLCVGSFEDANTALEKVGQCEPDIVLMDIEMPGVNGIEAVRQIKLSHPNISVLMQTIFDEEEMIFNAIKAGASGYLIKQSPPAKIIEGIREAHEGGAPMSPGIAAKVLNFFRTAPMERVTEVTPRHGDEDKAPELEKPVNLYGLTPRELEILQSLVEGNSYKMVAAALNVSYNTVNTHVRHIYGKLHVHSLGEVVAKALREKLV